MLFKTDLHIHSCLSPCGSLEMSPKAIVKAAVEQGIRCLSLTDHNCTGNCKTMSELCRRESITFLPGVELTTREEVHLLCIMQDLDRAEQFEKIICSNLPFVQNRPEVTGDQVVVNENDEIIEMVPNYLGTATGLSIQEAFRIVRESGGLAIPAHIDKPNFSIIAQLGFISGEFSAVEVSATGLSSGFLNRFDAEWPVITGSDSHYLHQIGSAHFSFTGDNCTFSELSGALEKGTFTLS